MCKTIMIKLKKPLYAGYNVGSLDVVWNMMLCIRPGPPLSWRYDIARGTMHNYVQMLMPIIC